MRGTVSLVLRSAVPMGTLWGEEEVVKPFFSIKPEGKGAGRGLSTVCGLVKQSDGHVNISSEPRRGTAIKLYLPRTFEKIDAVMPVDFKPVVGSTGTILVAENDECIRTNTAEPLRDFGYHVIDAQDAAEALQALRESPVNGLMTELGLLGMSGMSGEALARRVREVAGNIGVVFATGHDHFASRLADCVVQVKPHASSDIEQALPTVTERK